MDRYILSALIVCVLVSGCKSLNRDNYVVFKSDLAFSVYDQDGDFVGKTGDFVAEALVPKDDIWSVELADDSPLEVTVQELVRKKVPFIRFSDKAAKSYIKKYPRLKPLFGSNRKVQPVPVPKLAKMLSTFSNLDSRPYGKLLPGKLAIYGDLIREVLPEEKFGKGKASPDKLLYQLKSEKYTVNIGFLVTRTSLVKKKEKFMLIEVNGVRMAYPAKFLQDEYRKFFVNIFIRHALAGRKSLIRAGREVAYSPQPWVLDVGFIFQGCGSFFVRVNEHKTLLGVLNGQLFKIKGADNANSKESKKVFALFKLGNQLIKAIKSDTTLSDDAKKLLTSFALSAFRSPKGQQVILSQGFCKAAIADGYFTKVIPNCSKVILEKSKAFAECYHSLAKMYSKVFSGTSKDGSYFSMESNILNHKFTRYDAVKNETTFLTVPIVVECEAFDVMGFYNYGTVFAGKYTEVPKQAPIRYETWSNTEGKIAEYKVSTHKFQCDIEAWKRAAGAADMLDKKFYLTAEEIFPPHILVLNSEGRVKALVTPSGFLKNINFGKITDKDDRKEAKDQWLADCARLLPSHGELHLLFKFFFKYAYDSSITSHPLLIGSNDYKGDIHQTTYQTMDRQITGRLLGDCDDIAELFRDITRLQGKNSFVVSLPSHAACCWIEESHGKYVVRYLDTFPPKRFEDKNLDTAISNAYRSYDLENDSQFSPRAVPFLFRFSGEATRQPFMLDVRIFLDREYADKMVKLQEKLHSFLLLSSRNLIQEVLKDDKSAPNYFELSSIYQLISAGDKCIRTQREGVDAIGSKDAVGKINALFYLMSMQIEEKDLQGFRNSLAELSGIVESNKEDKALQRNASQLKLEIAATFLSIDKPFEGAEKYIDQAQWTIIESNVSVYHTAILFSLYSEMKNFQRQGKHLTPNQLKIMNKVEKVATKLVGAGFFKTEDSIQRIVHKYTLLMVYYSGKYGWDEVKKRLLQGGFPKGKRNHLHRTASSEEEDWNWIRLSNESYKQVIGEIESNEDWKNDMLDPKKLPQTVKFYEALKSSYKETAKYSLGNLVQQNFISDMMMYYAYQKKWDKISEGFDEMKKADWPSFYLNICEEIKQIAQITSNEEFEALIQSFAKRNPPKQYYFNIAYGVLAKSKKKALIVAKIARKKLPDNEAIQGEYDLFLKYLKTVQIK